MARQTKTRTGTGARVEEAAERIRDLNERIISSGKQAGDAFLDTSEKSLKSVADFQDKAADASQVEWLAAIGHSQAQFTRDLAHSYTSAARGLLR